MYEVPFSHKTEWKKQGQHFLNQWPHNKNYIIVHSFEKQSHSDGMKW